MSILLEFIPSVLAILAIDFLLYITGAGILRIISFGLLKYELPSYAEFKNRKEKSQRADAKGFLMPYFVGILFYVFIVALIVLLGRSI